MRDSTLFLTNMYCPACGEDSEASMLHDGYLLAHPTEPTLQCLSCNEKFCIEFYPVEEEEDEDEEDFD